MPQGRNYDGRSSAFRNGAGRLSMGDALGLTKALRTRLPEAKALRNPAVSYPPIARFSSTAFDPLAGPDGERVNVMSFGEQFVEALGEFVDAREQYAHSRRGVGGEYANPDEMNAAGDRLQKLIDRRLP